MTTNEVPFCQDTSDPEYPNGCQILADGLALDPAGPNAAALRDPVRKSQLVGKFCIGCPELRAVADVLDMSPQQ